MSDEIIFQLTLDEQIMLKKLTELYGHTKALLLYAEEVDPEFRSNLQAIKELRDAFDHTMRVFLNIFSEEKDKDTEYGRKNLDKAIGHTYRAAFDALDGAVVSLKVKLVEIMAGFDTRAIREVVNNYWEIKTHICNLEKNVAQHRGEKDIKSNHAELFEKYVLDVDKLKEYYDIMLASGPAIEECQAELVKRDGGERKSRIWHPLPSALLAAIIGGIIVFCLTQWVSVSSGTNINAAQAAQSTKNTELNTHPSK